MQYLQWACPPVDRARDCFKSLLVTGLWDIILTSLLHPLSKLLAIEDHNKTWRNNFEWEGGGRSALYLTDLWPGQFAARKVVFSWECLNIFATGCSKMSWEASCLSASSLLKYLHIEYLSNEIAYQIPHFPELWISWYSITFDPVKNFLLFCPFYLTG